MVTRTTMAAPAHNVWATRFVGGMMHCHCPPEFIERPELLIDALAAHDVAIELDSLTLQG